MSEDDERENEVPGEHRIPLRRVGVCRWEIPTSYKKGMRVPGLLIADRRLLEHILADEALEQVANVACLPGVVGYSLAMPDIHWGYGFPVGGVAAMRLSDGVISPGGVGYDISCGVRLIRSDLTEAEVRPRLEALADRLFAEIPAGVGTARSKLKLDNREMDRLLRNGAAWAVEHGYGEAADLEVTEEHGRFPTAEPELVSKHAKERGSAQAGSLGSGNHFAEVQVVDEIYDPEVAEVMGLGPVGQVCIFIHTGSRGLGHQVCDDFLKVMGKVMARLRMELPDRQLACAPIDSPEGQEYLRAMQAAANFAMANRQCITHWVRESFQQVFKRSWHHLGLRVVYDVSHNIAKLEEHEVDGERQTLCVHRKGATRAFPPHHPAIPEKYREVGQPVLIPGDMGRYSFVAVGTERAMRDTFGSTCHGAGRELSRHAAKKKLVGVDLVQQLKDRGILVRVTNPRLLAEEASEAYKDVADVVRVCERAGISRRVARLRPIAVIKG